MKIPRIVISGPRGGSGKTLLSLAIVAYLNFKKHMKVITFKKGPDYIDAGWLALASGNPCYNLDSFIIPEDRLLRSFLIHSTGDISVIEGNRGLFDGMDVEGTHSTARLSKLLKSPVILILDCTKVTRTTAAIVLGLMSFDKDVAIKGVVLNNVSGNRHEKLLRESIEKYCSVPVVGAIPRLSLKSEMELPERHMGLIPPEEHHRKESVIELALRIAEEYLEMGAILDIARQAPELSALDVNHESVSEGMSIMVNDDRFSIKPGSIRIGIVRDSAFQFYYEENFEELRNLGAELVEVNALKDPVLLEIDCLYIGGGFPETNAIGLSENKGFMKSLKDAIEDGLPVYAECGGMMYLGREIIYNGRSYPMAHVLPVSFEVTKKPVAHGYTIAEVTGENPFYKKGTILRGHEFHYSRPFDIGDMKFAFTMKRGDGIINKKDGIVYKNVLATYTHVHVYGNGQWAEGLIKKAIEFRRRTDAKDTHSC